MHDMEKRKYLPLPGLEIGQKVLRGEEKEENYSLKKND
jgi:hypothetical protein